MKRGLNQIYLPGFECAKLEKSYNDEKKIKSEKGRIFLPKIELRLKRILISRHRLSKIHYYLYQKSLLSTKF